ncbi:MAG: hypothetical protein CMB80_24855 [Flammeovirgaceae bacterium]|nr:hypothetical protein [Flammeovirgaceae bacterium]MBE63154.1 hypothetical protein [Flammeovirgaceae bacterium]|tara:strand:- start:2401 stop:3006 length:606 start_codon:yes stop_codon:yes gene_type:complete
MLKASLSIITLSLSTFICAQQSHEEEIKKWQTELNEEFANPEESPLEKKDLKKFKSHDFFPINENWRIEASFEFTPFQKPFTIPTTTDRLPVYVQYGIARFDIDGQSFEFPIYQNLELREQEEYKDYLFAPFTDHTNDFETYGGGRYIDLRIPKGDSIILDFNKAYNPYCAYSGRYSCPIPPAENDLALQIEAGVKAWDKD